MRITDVFKEMTKKRLAFFLISLALSLLWAGVIYGFSADTAGESSRQSSRVADFILKIFVSDYNELPELEQSRIYGICVTVVRKTAHFCVFAMLGFLSYFCVGSVKFLPQGLFTQAAVSVPLCVIFAVSDEIHQKFVDGRACRLLDVGIDSCGVLFGTAFAIVLSFVYKRLINKNE